MPHLWRPTLWGTSTLCFIALKERHTCGAPPCGEPHFPLKTLITKKSGKKYFTSPALAINMLPRFVSNKCLCGGMVDAIDSKSIVRMDVSVRVGSEVPNQNDEL
jgi:hypothetical protein